MNMRTSLKTSSLRTALAIVVPQASAEAKFGRAGATGPGETVCDRKPGSIRSVSAAGIRIEDLRRLTFLILPAALVLAVPAVASAATGSGSPEAAGARPATVDAAALTAALPTAMAATATNYIANGTAGVGLGVIHVRDGSYTHGTHDAVLPPNTYTSGYFGWTTTAGWYTGPGYCTYQYRNDDGGSIFTRQYPDIGPGQHFIGPHTRYLVYAYHC
jgi:hypothetical protein